METDVQDDENWQPSAAELEAAVADEILRARLLRLADRSRQSTVDFQRLRVSAEQEKFEVEQQLEESVGRLDAVTRGNDELRRRLCQLEAESAERARLLSTAELARDRTAQTRADAERRVDLLQGDKASLADLHQRQLEQTRRLEADVETLKAELKTLTMEKCQNQMQQDEMKSKELSLDYRERRWQQEKELMEANQQWSVKELANRDEQLQQLRKQLSMQQIESETQLNSVREELRSAKFSLQDHTAQTAQLNEQLALLNDKLKEASEDRAAAQATFDGELACNSRLLETFKESCSASEKRVEDLTGTLENIRSLYEEAKQNYFTIQEEMNQMQADNSSQIEQKDVEIADLKDELDKANELLRSKHRVMLTDEEVAALSPGAAAASRLVKSSHSLTEIYRKHLKVVEELEQQKVENRRVDAYFRELVQDIETKAPLLKQQRDDYLRSLDAVENLKRQLSAVGEEKRRVMGERDAAQRQLTYTRAELERFQRDNGDLSAQVRQLLQTIELARQDGGSLYYASAARDEGVDPSSEDLLLFRNIDDLQSTNQRLMSALRQAEAKREEMVLAAQEAEMGKVRAELSSALRELESFREHRLKQNHIIETVEGQRDTYRRLFEEQKQKLLSASPESAKTSSLSENAAAASAADVSAQAERVNAEFEIYRKDKLETEKLLNSKLEQLQTTATELRAANARLEAESDYQAQRFRILQQNAEGFQRETERAKERLAAATATGERHEQRAADLQRQLFAARDELAGGRAERRAIEQQLLAARSAEQRLQLEADTLHKQDHKNEMLITSLNEMQARLERVEAEKSLRRQQSIDTLSSERDNLQKTIGTLNAQQQEYVQDTKAKIVELQRKVDEEQLHSRELKAQLDLNEETAKNKESQLAALQTQLDEFNSMGKDASAERYQKESQQLQTRLNYLEQLFNESKRKLVESETQLHEREAEIKKLREVSTSMETNLEEQKTVDADERSQLGSDLESVRAELAEVERRLAEATLEKTSFADSAVRLRDEAVENESALRAEVARLSERLSAAHDEAADSRRQLHTACQDRDRQAQLVQQIQMKCLDVEIRGASLAAERDRLSASVDQLRAELTSATSEAKSMREQMTTDEVTREQSEKEGRAQLEAAEERAADLTRRNEELYEWLQSLGNQLDVLQKHQPSASDDGATSAAADGGAPTSAVVVDSSSSVASLMEVVRYLRGESRAAEGRAETAEADSRRWRSKAEVVETQLARVEAELDAARLDASVTSEVVAEKSRLMEQLAALQTTEAENRRLAEERRQLQAQVEAFEQQAAQSAAHVAALEADAQTLGGKLESAAAASAALQHELEQWQRRHAQLAEERSRVDPEKLTALRSELEESRSFAATCKREKDGALASYEQAKSQCANLQQDVDDLNSKLKDLQGENEALQQDMTRTKTNMERARQLAIKYRDSTASLKKDVEEKTKRIEELSNKDEAAASDEAATSTEGSTLSMQKLMPRLNALQTQLLDSRKKMEEMSEKLEATRKDKTVLEEEVAALKASMEEKSFRLQSIASLHSQCPAKMQELQAQLRASEEQSAALRRQLQLIEQQAPAAAAGGAPPPPAKQVAVQPVPAMPSLAAAAAADRPSTSAAASPRLPSAGPFRLHTRPTPAPSVAVNPVRRLGLPVDSESADPMDPTPRSARHASPGPQPDQSTSAVAPAQAAVAPIVVSTTMQQPPPPNTAVIMPHVEPQQQQVGLVSGSGDAVPAHAAACSSSSSSAPVAERFDEASRSSSPAPTSTGEANRKRPIAEPSSPPQHSAKRARGPSPMEMVTTSSQPARYGADDSGDDAPPGEPGGAEAQSTDDRQGAGADVDDNYAQARMDDGERVQMAVHAMLAEDDYDDDDDDEEEVEEDMDDEEEDVDDEEEEPPSEAEESDGGAEAVGGGDESDGSDIEILDEVPAPPPAPRTDFLATRLFGTSSARVGDYSQSFGSQSSIADADDGRVPSTPTHSAYVQMHPADAYSTSRDVPVSDLYAQQLQLELDEAEASVGHHPYALDHAAIFEPLDVEPELLTTPGEAMAVGDQAPAIDYYEDEEYVAEPTPSDAAAAAATLVGSDEGLAESSEAQPSEPQPPAGAAAIAPAAAAAAAADEDDASEEPPEPTTTGAGQRVRLKRSPIVWGDEPQPSSSSQRGRSGNTARRTRRAAGRRGT